MDLLLADAVPDLECPVVVWMSGWNLLAKQTKTGCLLECPRLVCAYVRATSLMQLKMVGRAWKVDELRLKSEEDLHKLWFVMVKEKNLINSQRAQIAVERDHRGKKLWNYYGTRLRKVCLWSIRTFCQLAVETPLVHPRT